MDITAHKQGKKQLCEEQIGSNAVIYTLPYLKRLETNMDEEFTYNGNQSFEENFDRWFVLNSEERSAYNLKPYEREEAKNIFANYVRDKWQEDPKKKSPS